eukprot:63730-Hanusia_phi.AAC.1
MSGHSTPIINNPDLSPCDTLRPPAMSASVLSSRGSIPLRGEASFALIHQLSNYFGLLEMSGDLTGRPGPGRGTQSETSAALAQRFGRPRLDSAS